MDDAAMTRRLAYMELALKHIDAAKRELDHVGRLYLASSVSSIKLKIEREIDELRMHLKLAPVRHRYGSIQD